MKTLLITAPMPPGYFSTAIRELDPTLDLVEYGATLSDAELAAADAVLAWQLPAGLAGRLPRLKWVCAGNRFKRHVFGLAGKGPPALGRSGGVSRLGRAHAEQRRARRLA